MYGYKIGSEPSIVPAMGQRTLENDLLPPPPFPFCSPSGTLMDSLNYWGARYALDVPTYCVLQLHSLLLLFQ